MLSADREQQHQLYDLGLLALDNLFLQMRIHEFRKDREYPEIKSMNQEELIQYIQKKCEEKDFNVAESFICQFVQEELHAIEIAREKSTEAAASDYQEKEEKETKQNKSLYDEFRYIDDFIEEESRELKMQSEKPKESTAKDQQGRSKMLRKKQEQQQEWNKPLDDSEFCYIKSEDTRRTLRLLKNYLCQSALGRFFAGHWHRHHCPEIEKVLQEYQPDPLFRKGYLNTDPHHDASVTDVLQFLKNELRDTPINQKGDLYFILETIKNNTLAEYDKLTAQQELEHKM